MKLTAADLSTHGMIDDVIPEPPGGAHQDHAEAASQLQKSILRHLRHLKKLPPASLLTARYEKFRKFGEFTEKAAGS